MFSASLTPAKASLGASPCTLSWNRSLDTNVTGYAVYYGTTGSGTTNRVNAGATNQVTIYNLTASSNCFFYVTAYNAAGLESPPSGTIACTPQAFSTLMLAASTNGGVSVKFKVATNASCHVEYTPTLSPAQWQTLTNVVADAYGNVSIRDPLAGKPGSRFYRAVEP